MRVLACVIVVAAICLQARVDPARAYDVAPACTVEEFIELYDSDYSAEEIIELCKLELADDEEDTGAEEAPPDPVDCSGLGCYEPGEEGKFINGKNVPQQPTEDNQNAGACAERCNKDDRCLSFEIYKGDVCSLNAANTKTDPDILWDSENYVYYEHIYRKKED